MVGVKAGEMPAGETAVASQFVNVFAYEHDISIASNSEIIVANEPSAITVNIHNYGAIEDSVYLYPWSDSANIAFSIYDNGIPVISAPVSVPANSSHELMLIVTPQSGAHGTIMINAVSEYDPLASDTVSVLVNPISSYLPLAVRSY